MTIIIVVGFWGGPVAAQESPVVNKLTDSVYAIFAVFYHSLVVIGSDGVLITDPANAYRAALVKAEVAKLTDKPVDKIVLSNEDFDHVGGREVFDGAVIIAQENVKSVFGFDPLGVAPDVVDVTCTANHEIDLGTTNVQLKHLGAGDAVATTAVLLPREGIVATADLYDDGALTSGEFLDDKNMLGTRAILNEVAGWELNHAINTYSTSTDPKILRDNAKYYNDPYDAVFPVVEKTAKTNPAGIWDLPASLGVSVKLPAYENWDSYDQLPHHVRRVVLEIIHGG